MSEGAAAPELSLLFAGPEGHPVVFPIPEGTTTLGSASDNDLVLSDASISPHQIVLMREGDDLQLQDLFAGETKVNGAVRRKGALNAGDMLLLGDVKLRVMRIAPRSATRKLDPARNRTTTRRLRLSNLLGETASSPAPERAPAPQEEIAPPRPLAQTDAQATSSDPQVKVAQEAPKGTPTREQRDLEDRERLACERDARRARALAKARQLGDELMVQDDFEEMLERIAVSFLDVFVADRAVTVLFEEDGRNPLLTVERRRDGTDEGTGVAQEIIDRCLQVRSVVRVAGGMAGTGGLAAPLLTQGRALGLLYFERTLGNPHQLDADDVHLMAMLTNLASLLIAPLVD